MSKKRFRNIFREYDQFSSLNFKMTVAILIAAVLALGFFTAGMFFRSQLVNVYLKEDRVKKSVVNERFEKFQEFIEEYNVSTSDASLLQKWVDTEDYTQLVISDLSGELFTYGWLVDSTGSVVTDEIVESETEDQTESLGDSEETGTAILGTLPGFPEAKESNIDKESFSEDLYNRIVKFSDGEYYVFINVYFEYRWERIINILVAVLTVLIFVLIILWYNKATIRRIINLSDEVRTIKDGVLDHPFSPKYKDEIGDLANSVDELRKSLIDKTASEKAAMDANTELITSMSHDIRTPLTSLIGYLDIIAGGKYRSQEELDKYIGACKERATRLKDLSDKLFNYFLVFGEQEKELDLEVVDGGVFFRQIIGEHLTEVEAYGYKINLQYNVPDGVMINIDVSAVMRVFDNLFSNINKYASDRFPVEIKADYLLGKIKIIFQNHISDEAKLVESTKIGVKTCKKICEDHGATFKAMEEERIYTTEILFPVYEVQG